MEAKHTRSITDGPAVARSGLAHRVGVPDGPGPHPTVVMLHGRSGNEDVMWAFGSTPPPDWLVISARGIRPDPRGGYAWHARPPSDWPSVGEFDRAVEAVTRFIHALPDLYGARLDRVYVMGFSQGAATAFALAMQRPGLVRGIVGLVGFVPEAGDGALSALRDLPVLMIAGRRDPRIPLARADADAERLRRAGARVEYRVYDTEHRLNLPAMRDLQQWWQARTAGRR